MMRGFMDFTIIEEKVNDYRVAVDNDYQAQVLQLEAWFSERNIKLYKTYDGIRWYVET